MARGKRGVVLLVLASAVGSAVHAGSFRLSVGAAYRGDMSVRLEGPSHSLSAGPQAAGPQFPEMRDLGDRGTEEARHERRCALHQWLCRPVVR